MKKLLITILLFTGVQVHAETAECVNQREFARLIMVARQNGVTYNDAKNLLESTNKNADYMRIFNYAFTSPVYQDKDEVNEMVQTYAKLAYDFCEGNK